MHPCQVCHKPHRITKKAIKRLGDICRPCYKKEHRVSRPILSRERKIHVNVKRTKSVQPQAKKGKRNESKNTK